MNERKNELFHSSKKKHTHRLTPKYPLGPETTKRTLVIKKTEETLLCRTKSDPLKVTKALEMAEPKTYL